MNGNLVGRDGTDVLNESAQNHVSPADVGRRLAAQLHGDDDWKEENAAQRAVAQMDLLVDEQEKEYEFLCQAPLHQHLQVHSLPHTDDR